MMKTPSKQRRGSRRTLARAAALGSVAFAATACFDPLIEDPGTTNDPGHSPLPGVPDPVAPGGQAPDVAPPPSAGPPGAIPPPSSSVNPGDGTLPPAATATVTPVIPLPTASQSAAPTPVTPPVPPPSSTDDEVDAPGDGGTSSSESTSSPFSTMADAESATDAGSGNR